MLRYEGGICEDENSVLKRMFLDAEISKQRTFSRLTNVDSSGRNTKMINLPSPSQAAGSSLKHTHSKFDSNKSKIT